MPDRKTYSLNEVAQAIGRSTAYVRSCMRSINPDTHRPLEVKQWPDGKYFVTAKELDRWIDSHEDV